MKKTRRSWQSPRECPRCRHAKHACPRLTTTGGTLVLSLRETARVLRVHFTRPYALIRAGDLVSAPIEQHAGVLYVRALDVEAYRLRRDAHLQRFGRRVPRTRTAVTVE